MPKVSREELLKIAHISHIELHEDEMESMLKQLDAVLSYAVRVSEIAGEIEEPSTKQINVFREDVVVPFDVEAVLRQAPEREETFFVVPKILETNS